MKLEHEGPPVEDAGDGKYSHSVSGTSSDIITCENIATIVEKATKIPVQRLLSTDKGRLLNLERALRQQVCFPLPSNRTRVIYRRNLCCG